MQLHNHKPLQPLFSETRPIPAMASARIQRWALTLSTYSYTIAYKPGGDHINADVLSRLPLPEAPSEVPLPGETVPFGHTSWACDCHPDQALD